MAAARSSKKRTDPAEKQRDARPAGHAANASAPSIEDRIPTREEALAWIEDGEAPGGTYEPDKEEIIDMIQEGMRQLLSGEGRRPARELLKELEEELRPRPYAVDPTQQALQSKPTQ